MDFVKPSKSYRTINGTYLTLAREAAGLTQKQLAALVAQKLNRCSLSLQYIAQLERPGDKEIRIETAEALDAVFSEFNKPCCDPPSKEKCDQCQEIGLANPLNH